MTPLFRAQSPSRFALVALALALAIGALIVSAVTTQKLHPSFERLRIAIESRLALEQMLSAMKDAETAQRGFVISGDETYLELLNGAIQQLPTLFERAYGYAGAVEAERRELAVIRLLCDQKIAELRESVTLRRRLGTEAAVEVVITGEGKRLMEDIRTRLTTLLNRHNDEIEHSRQAMETDLLFGEMAAIGSGLVALLCGGIALLQFRTAVRKAQEAERLAREKLTAEAAGREKSVFLATMSHEIRTPMNAILGFGEILRGELADGRLRGFADSILESGNSLLRLINDILDLSKIEAGKLKLRIEPVDVRATAQFVNRLFALQSQQQGLSWEVRVAEDLPTSVLMDEIRVRQVLLNLVGNAFKFTQQGGVTLIVRAQARDDAPRSRVDLVFEVRDTGVGISPDKIDRVFEPFVQAGASGPSDARGTGLGLSIVRRLVQSMNGRITVESQLGLGSVFRVELTDVNISARLPADAAAEAADVVDFNQLTPARILVVDDVETNRAFLREIFASTHHTVIEAADGREAVERALADRPDLVLMDVRMPELNGDEALREIRRSAGFELLPVIAVTASSLREEEPQLRRDFSGYLRKPFSRAQLFAELSAFLKRLAQTEVMPLPVLPETPLPAAAVVRLQRLLAEDFPRVRDGLAAKDVRGFAEALAALAAGHDAPALQLLASDLHAAAENFSVHQMEAALGKFPALVARLAPTA